MNRRRHRRCGARSAWLEAHQNDDGGWGEDLRSYTDAEWHGRGTSTASQTAWALLALLAADPTSAAVTRGVQWLTSTQRADGGWDEDLFTGTGFPGDFYINYELYRLVFPLSASVDTRSCARVESYDATPVDYSSSLRCAVSTPRWPSRSPERRWNGAAWAPSGSANGCPVSRRCSPT